MEDQGRRSLSLLGFRNGQWDAGGTSFSDPARCLRVNLRRMQRCVTATNPNMNIVQWFGDNVFGDLQAAAGSGIHPALHAMQSGTCTHSDIGYVLFFRRALVTCAFISRDSSRRSNWSRYFRCY